MALEAGAPPRILCVDDEPRVLEGIQRTLGLDFEVTTAPGGAEAIELLKSQGPFCVTISDMRMPGMDGAAYLKQAAELAPDCVRMLLTGHADMEAAIKAVNEGRLYRFLTKPCAPEALRRSVDDAVTQHRLITAEKQLLEQTLYGVIKVLTEVLSLANPIAFARASRVRHLVALLCRDLNIADAWQFELAIMLAHIGCVGLSSELLTRAFGNQPLEAKEKELVSGAPRVAYGLLEGIPRLEVSLGILAELTNKPAPLRDVRCDGVAGRTAWGTHLILLSERADQLRTAHGLHKMMSGMEAEKHFDPTLLAAFLKLDPLQIDPNADQQREVKEITARELKSGLVLIEDVRSKAGVVMVKAGQEVNQTVLQLLKRMGERDNLVEPLKVAAVAQKAAAPKSSEAVRIRL
jgi:CheY-like chemotaxis protein